MEKRTAVIFIAVLLTFGAVMLVVKNLDFLVKKYDWKKAELTAETNHVESIRKFKSGQKISSDEINQLVVYYSLKSKEDEGINLLKEIIQRQDSYVAYFGVSQLYAAKARMKSSPKAHLDFISNSSIYLSQGFDRVPDKALAYFTRGNIYSTLGCSEMYINDLKKAIEESKNAKIVLIDDGVYVDRARFVEFVQKTMNRERNRGPCLLDEIQRK